MSGTVPVTTFWRIAGMTYLQYVNRAAGSVRSALKEPAKSKLMPHGNFSYKAASWSGGQQGVKEEINVLSKAGSTA